MATLAAQFFFDWVFIRVKWFTNYTSSGSVVAPDLNFFGFYANKPIEKYLVCLLFVTVFALLAKNEAETIDVSRRELAISRRGALGIDETLTLEKTDLRDGDVVELGAELVEDVPDRHLRGGRHVIPPGSRHRARS